MHCYYYIHELQELSGIISMNWEVIAIWYKFYLFTQEKSNSTLEDKHSLHLYSSNSAAGSLLHPAVY